LTTHAFLPRSVAGVEVYTDRLARALQQLGHTVWVLTAVHDLAARPHSIRPVSVGPVEVFELVNARLEGRLTSSYALPEIGEAIRSLLEQLRPDCVHAQHLLNLSADLLGSARRLGAAVVLTVHDYWLSCPRDGLRMRADGFLCQAVDHRVCSDCLSDSPYLVGPVQRLAARAARALALAPAVHWMHGHNPAATTAALRLIRGVRPPAARDLRGALESRQRDLQCALREVDLVLAPTRFARDRAVEWGVPAPLVRVEPLGAIETAPRARPAGPRRRFGYLGSLLPHKGVHLLVESFRRLTRADVSLQIFGDPGLDPSYARDLRRLANGDPRIHFRGAAQPGDSAVWACLDLLVLPSLWWENSPLSMLEALGWGVPVVASRTGGVPELIPASAGVLTSPGDVQALADVLAAAADGRILSEPLAPLPMRTAAHQAAALGELYAGLIAERGRHP